MEDRHEKYGDLFRRAEADLVDIEKLQEQEITRIMNTFRELREALDRKEQEFKSNFKERSKDQYSHLCKETSNLRFVFGEINHVY